MSTEQHRATAPASVRCCVITISDTRTAANDTSGDAIAGLLADAGHMLVRRAIVPDEPAAVQQVIRSSVGDADAVITTGGTGITSRDSTFEAVNALYEKRLDGFGELFRMLSYEQI
jgi:molybdenum cofactor biosynthesis protein B